MKIAVVGSGVSGLSAAWSLKDKHEVHLFEADSRLGGHANTVSVVEAGKAIPMDTGFLVFNELTYPNLTSFFKTLGVETVDSDMSLSIQVKSKNLEWNGSSLPQVFGQKRNLFRPRFHRMLLEILRFNREAEENLGESLRCKWTLRELLYEKHFSRDFYEDYLLPCGAAIWSTPEREMLDFPAATFLTFFANHRLMQIQDRPVWKTVKGGSIQYVSKVARTLPHVHLNTPVRIVTKTNRGVLLSTGSSEAYFDRVVMATHAPLTAKIVQSKDPTIARVLANFRYEPNVAVLHRDLAPMPSRKFCWASWNAVGNYGMGQRTGASLTYYLNRLQPLATKTDYFVTLNPQTHLESVIEKIDYSHPQFDSKAIAAQSELPKIQGLDGIYFAGAWTRYGFHEDGFLSGIRVAEAIAGEESAAGTNAWAV